MNYEIYLELSTIPKNIYLTKVGEYEIFKCRTRNLLYNQTINDQHYKFYKIQNPNFDVQTTKYVVCSSTTKKHDILYLKQSYFLL